ncbi:DNA helicase [Methylobacterium sp. JK268]
MLLSAPIHGLKRTAKRLSRRDGIPLHDALDRVARREGFARWSLLVARFAAEMEAEATAPLPVPADGLLARLDPGDLLLVGARPGHGKTRLSLALAVEAVKAGRQAAFFTLVDNERQVRDRLAAIGAEPDPVSDRLMLDCSDAVSAGYIAATLPEAGRGDVVVVDYLQVLDQRRENPDLASQLAALKSLARDRGLIVTVISQIDRRYNPAQKPCPDLDDVRLPNPADLRLFDKTCFLQGGTVRFGAARPG